MKATYAWSTAICCLSLLFANAGEAGQTTHNGQAIDPCCEYQDGPCVCYCPMVKYKPKYHCEKKCYTEAYQVPRKCCRYVPEYYTKTFCRQVPEYYTKTFCRQKPEYYTVCDTKYRTKYYTVTHCTYEPCRYTVKKCGVCPQACDNGCSTGGCPSGGCAVNGYAKGGRSYSNGQYAAKPSSVNTQQPVALNSSSQSRRSK